MYISLFNFSLIDFGILRISFDEFRNLLYES